jgi:predicted dehydrogenase
VVTKIIHVGLGGWGGDWERNAIPPVKEVERVAVVDAHEPTLRKLQEAMKLPDAMCFTSFTEALEKVDADAVLITAPMVAHIPLALEALNAGKHVLVEKPFAGSVAEAKTAVDRAEELGLIIQVSQNYRFYSGVRTARRLIEEGAIGDPSVIRIDFRRFANSSPVEGSRHYLFQHPLLFDMSIHHFDMIRKITGEEAKKVYAKVTDPKWSHFKEEASAVLTIEMQSGLVISYRGSWISTGAPTPWAGEWHIEGEKGEIYFQGREGGTIGTEEDIVTLRPTGGEATSVVTEKMDLWGRSYGLRAFAQAINGGPLPETNGRANLGSVALMEAAAKSSLSGEVEDVIIPE